MNAILSRISSSLCAVLAATAVLSGGGTAIAVLSGTVPAALAQDQGQPAAPDAGHRPRMGQILMSLDLTDAQKTQIKAIMADTRKQNHDVTDREQRRANYKAAMAKVETVLTPAQRTQLHAKIDAMHQPSAPAHS